MSKEAEYEKLEKVKKNKHSPELKYLLEALALRRQRYLELLEVEENAEARGRSKECRDLIKLLSE